MSCCSKYTTVNRQTKRATYSCNDTTCFVQLICACSDTDTDNIIATPSSVILGSYPNLYTVYLTSSAGLSNTFSQTDILSVIIEWGGNSEKLTSVGASWVENKDMISFIVP